MKPHRTSRNSRLARMGCAVLCVFYLLGLFNGLVLETLHEVSHIIGPKIHHHNFASSHERMDYSSLEAMAGHSHEALEALKQLLEANQQDEQESNSETNLKLDKHIVEESYFVSERTATVVQYDNWEYKSVNSFWYEGVRTPPPQNS
ncbi:hypothetical protein HPE56_11240 [Maribacter sp. ANRC-HE7]|uniref:Uncharacterized protein n=1 Tax=Maribacter aquimaris TaxID=2737171 RepID=A0ABR7V5G8_9FLAO|nr:hypothetical protein [Maribacter aquimaris]MBD0778368.1 hypothetical protein [Maribacter aquimaris]